MPSKTPHYEPSTPLSLVRYHRIVRTRPARGSGICNTPLCTRQPIRHGLNSCQFLAPTTYVYTSPEKRGQALLEWGCQGMQRVEADTDQPSASPPRAPRHRVHFLKPADQPIAL